MRYAATPPAIPAHLLPYQPGDRAGLVAVLAVAGCSGDDVDRTTSTATESATAAPGPVSVSWTLTEPTPTERVVKEPEGEEEVRAYVLEVMTLLEEEALFAEGKDWAQLRTAALRRTEGMDDTRFVQDLLRPAITAAGSRHSNILDPEEAAALLGSDAGAALELPTTSRPGPGVVRIALPTGGDVADRYERAGIQAVADTAKEATCGWVVDVRGNIGGNVTDMVGAVAPPLSGGRLLGFRFADGTQEWVDFAPGTMQVADAETLSYPPRVQQPTGTPVAVLTDRETASAAEPVVIAFTGQEQVRTFGERTFGVPTRNLLFDLSDGAMLVLSTSRMVDRTGTAYDGSITPDEVIETDATTNGDPVLDAATDWLTATC